MPRKILDLSRPLENTTHADPPGLAPQITYMDHSQTAERMLKFFPGVTPDQLPRRRSLGSRERADLHAQRHTP